MSGHDTVPLGNPDLTGAELEHSSLTRMFFILGVQIQFKMGPRIPSNIKLLKQTLVGNGVKCLLKV